MLTEKEIIALKNRVALGNVWWLDDGRCQKVHTVLLDWVEFEDEPTLTEPAAILVGGMAVALANVELSSFVTIAPCFN
jgi:hypothetical protein